MDVNASQLTDFQRDELSWFYKYVQRRSRRGEGYALPLQIGIWFHSLMESYFAAIRGEHDHASPKSIAAVEATKTLIEMKLALESVGSFDTLDFNRECLSLLELFSSRWQLSYTPTKILQVEEILRVPIGASGHHIIGIPDTVIRINGLWWHLSHKTMSDRTPVQPFIEAMARNLNELLYAHMICTTQAIDPSLYGGTYLNIARKLSAKAARERPESAFVQALIPIDPSQVSYALSDVATLVARMQSIINEEIPPVDNRDSDLSRWGRGLSPYFRVKTNTEDLFDDSLFEPTVTRYDQEPA
jgi:hypothetical protein